MADNGIQIQIDGGYQTDRPDNFGSGCQLHERILDIRKYMYMYVCK